MFWKSKNKQLEEYLNFKFPKFKFKITGDVGGKKNGEFDIFWTGSQEIRPQVELWATWWIGESVQWTFDPE